MFPDCRSVVIVPTTVGTEVALAGFDSTIVFTPPTDAMVVPLGMPTPVTGRPVASPLKLLSAWTVVLPLVRKAVGLAVLVPVVVAVAADEIVRLFPFASAPIAVTVDPAGMPVPEIPIPNRTPLVLETEVISVLPLVTNPVGATELVAEALPATATVPAEALTVVMYEFEARPVALTSCP